MLKTSKLIALLISAVFMVASAFGGITDKVGAMGDSLTDQGMFPETDYQNWVAQLVGADWNFGVDYQYNAAVSGATASSLLAQGQHTELASYQTNLAVFEIGGNDITMNLLSLSAPPADLDAFADQRIDDITTAVNTVAGTASNPTGTKMVLCTMPDVMLTPVGRGFFLPLSSPEMLAAEEYVSARINAGIKDLARERKFPVVDLDYMMNDVIGNINNPNEYVTIGGVDISLMGHGDTAPVPTDGFATDGFHPWTALQGLLSNMVIEAVNQGYAENLPFLSDQDILANAGVSNIPSGVSYFDVSEYVVVPEPTCLILLSMGGLVLIRKK